MAPAGRVSPIVRRAGAIRLVHPFPSALDAAVVAGVATVAGASPGVALRLGLSMLLLQFAIGTLNDVVDAPADRGRKPGKPIPAGLVPVGVARLVGAACALAGIALAFAAGPAPGVLALVGLGIGASYDLLARGTALSWLPLAVGIPLLPVFGWLGATGSLPAAFWVLVPVAAVAGAGLAVANALVDVERDAAAGRGSVAVALGPRLAGRVAVALHALVAVVALGAAAAMGAGAGWLLAMLAAVAIVAAAGVLGAVAAVRPRTAPRELAWEIQAVGTALLAVAWLGAIASMGAA